MGGDVAIGFEEIQIGKKIYTGEYLILILTPKFLTHGSYFFLI